ncbi:hypothetical protein [Aestuariispira ectoiniformans]|uniref:hypothetical protein n=1 Tax=Aestuariispira ectoiniformans TaxID=2775080 RepID=UPI00223AC9A6|nr:hypothetical protein [Aestuariispira ectoiniformans]
MLITLLTRGAGRLGVGGKSRVRANQTNEFETVPPSRERLEGPREVETPRTVRETETSQRNVQVEGVDSKNNIVNGGRPISFDGHFYSADGFKFSKSYYEYLYKNGRPAPFLQAREVLNSNPKVMLDPQGAVGHFRYEGAGLEMI